MVADDVYRTRIIQNVENWYNVELLQPGRLAQLAARVLSMHEVAGSIPATSTFLFLLNPAAWLIFPLFKAFSALATRPALVC